MGITPGAAGLRCSALTANEEKKKTTPKLQKVNCVWSGASSLSPLLDAGEVVSASRALFWAPCLGGMGGKLEPGSVWWAQGGELGRFGWQRGGRGAPAAAA